MFDWRYDRFRMRDSFLLVRAVDLFDAIIDTEVNKCLIDSMGSNFRATH